MPVVEFESFIEKARRQFRVFLDLSDGSFRRFRMKKMLKGFLDECSNQFEEVALKENLQEEFGLYLESLKEQA